MFYKVIEYFGPEVDSWAPFVKDHYIKNLSSFESVDGILCPSKFTPESIEDWENCVNEDFIIEYISNLDYALKIQKKYLGSRLVGLQLGENCDGVKTLAGYDILDGYNDVSLITNWGPHEKDHPLRDFKIQNNGLIPTYSGAETAVKLFIDNHGKDDHVKGCRIWAVHNP